MYILIKVNELDQSEVHQNRQSIIDRLNVNRRTLNKAIDNNMTIENYYIVKCELIKNKKKGRDFNTISIGY